MRAPGLENLVQTETLGEGHYRMRMEQPAGRLNRDFVVYYKLADNLPGRIEVIPHRADPGRNRNLHDGGHPRHRPANH